MNLEASNRRETVQRIQERQEAEFDSYRAVKIKNRRKLLLDTTG